MGSSDPTEVYARSEGRGSNPPTASTCQSPDRIVIELICSGEDGKPNIYIACVEQAFGAILKLSNLPEIFALLRVEPYTFSTNRQ
jgi:hypothetical protein